jgi:hypothetical protein
LTTFSTTKFTAEITGVIIEHTRERIYKGDLRREYKATNCIFQDGYKGTEKKRRAREEEVSKGGNKEKDGRKERKGKRNSLF